MKVAIIGSRNFDNYDRMREILDQIEISLIVSGGAKGADTLAEQYAEANNITTKIFLPKFKTDPSIPYHPKWFFERNKDIVNEADVVIAFWDGESTGTKHAIDYATNQKKIVHVINFEQ